MKYRAEATSLEGLIQQLAVCYVGRGYWFYKCGLIPPHKDPAVCAKLIARYDIAISKTERARRKAAGRANMQLIQFGNHFWLIATAGAHLFFAEESGVLDCRKVPIKFGGYAISFRAGHVQVRIERRAWQQLQAYYLDRATKRSVIWFEREFKRWPFEPWAPVRRQTFAIVNQVNHVRKAAGLELIEPSCVRLKRRILRPFEEQIAAGVATAAMAQLGAPQARSAVLQLNRACS